MNKVRGVFILLAVLCVVSFLYIERQMPLNDSAVISLDPDDIIVEYTPEEEDQN